MLTSVALVALVAGSVYVVAPEIIGNSVVGDALPMPLERAWSLAYAVGGLAILIGVYRLDSRWEVAGLLAVAGCDISYGYALFAERGFTAASIAAPVFFGLGGGCLVRAFLLRFEPGGGPWQSRR